MNRLNYFNPYNSKSDYHEDRLTRAFLIVLRYSPAAFSFFYETVLALSDHKEELPLLSAHIDDQLDFETQVGSTQFETAKLLSILITDDDYAPTVKIAPVDRGAVYDGIITLGNELAMIIETKPNRGHVWQEQLCPSMNHLGEDTMVLAHPVVLKWYTIIKWMNQFINSDRYHFTEKSIVSDFLAFVDSNFGYLNPFDGFHLCKRDHGLIYKRIQNILKSLVKDDNLVKYHHGWGFYIEVPYRSIRKIGLIFDAENEILKLSLFFADTQGQAKALYPINVEPLDFEADGWHIYPNFHFAFITSNIIWFHSKSTKEFIAYWNKKAPQLTQLSNHSDLRVFLKELVAEGIVEDQPEAMEKKIFITKMERINVCPGLGFVYEIPITKAEELDEKGILEKHLKERIVFCIQNVIGEDIATILN